MRGYVGEAELPSGAWFETRDLGFIDPAGRLHVLGRSDDVIITGGENVHPAEVEAVLCQSAGVRDALVCAVSDADWGQRVGALLVLEPAVTVDAVIASAAQRLARFKLPRTYRLVGELPLTPRGKPDRNAAALMLSEQSE